MVQNKINQTDLEEKGNPALEHGVQAKKLFYSGYEESKHYRIPSILTTRKGTVIAAADKRNQHIFDWGDIDVIIRRKEADETEFGAAQVILNLIDNREGEASSAFTIDPCMLEDKETGRLFLLVDMFPESKGFFSVQEAGGAYTEIEGKTYQMLYDDNGNSYTIRNGEVFYSDGRKSEYYLQKEVKPPYRELGNLYKEDKYCGNIYLYTGADKGELHVQCTNYLWLLHSDDDGKSWSVPQDITPMVKKEWMTFLGVGPGVGIQLHNGNLVFPVYHTNIHRGPSQSSAVIISGDHGATWKIGESPMLIMGDDPSTKESGGLLTESQMIQTEDGKLKMFMRNTFENYIYVATSETGGESWETCEPDFNIPEYWCQLSVLHYQRDGKEYLVLVNPSVEERTDGRIYYGEITPDGKINWLNSRLLAKGHFQYSCITRNQKGNFEILYELDDENGTIALWHTELTEKFIAEKEKR